MIFVIVGLHTQGFTRLIAKMDDIADRIGEEVVMQIGTTDYKPKNATHFRFTDEETMYRLYSRARVVVCHCGAGTIIDALRFNKMLIIVPRLKKYAEHFDNHQLELADMLRQKGINVVYDLREIDDMLNSTCSKNRDDDICDDKRIISYLREYITKLE